MENTITVVINVPGSMKLAEAGDLQGDIREAVEKMVDTVDAYDGVVVQTVYLSSRIA